MFGIDEFHAGFFAHYSSKASSGVIENVVARFSVYLSAVADVISFPPAKVQRVHRAVH